MFLPCNPAPVAVERYSANAQGYPVRHKYMQRLSLRCLLPTRAATICECARQPFAVMCKTVLICRTRVWYQRPLWASCFAIAWLAGCRRFCCNLVYRSIGGAIVVVVVVVLWVVGRATPRWAAGPLPRRRFFSVALRPFLPFALPRPRDYSSSSSSSPLLLLAACAPARPPAS